MNFEECRMNFLLKSEDKRVVYLLILSQISVKIFAERAVFLVIRIDLKGVFLVLTLIFFRHSVHFFIYTGH